MRRLPAPIRSAATALFLAMATLLAPLPAAADVDRLVRALDMDGVVRVMAEEGLAYGTDLDRDMLNGRGGADWAAEVADIYDPARLAATVTPRFEAALAGHDVAAMTAFFDSDLGRRIVRLEISAREAFLDEAVEEAARLRLEEMRAEADPRLDRIAAFIAAGDLIEANVAGGLNSSLAFWKGLRAGGFLDRQMTEDDVLTEIWGQEPEVRAETTDWLYSYLLLAYEPLEAGDLEAYIAFSRTPAGRALNRALFAGFDAMFTDVSFRLGLGVARELAGEEL